MELEIWKPVIGHEQNYEVSNHGRVRRSSTCCASKAGRILGQYDGHGYLNVALCSAGKVSKYRTHVLVARAFIPNPDSKEQVNHKDCDKTNNRDSNLEWVTAKENREHATLNGCYSHFKGGTNPMSKLTAEQVLALRASYSKGTALETLAQEYNIHYQTAYKIVQRKRWTHI